jgi:hypothetical protein
LEYELNKKIGCNAPFSADDSTEIAGIVPPANSEMNDPRFFSNVPHLGLSQKSFVSPVFIFFRTRLFNALYLHPKML